ncbi:Ribosomal-protein-S18p-alanine acetyltransferase [Weissella jogaejeotgali]|uniref:Ribosomal-protein-S18p-alanine acetyltransferase n=2 Tax=Weissella TaxID=46255 RepID=A0A1L6RDN5_9LACO|nr:ribosomal protein S18-alanine N-acetyltransferase [Weissella jogaejeotgali]APS42590.1 Ribosomal-protein-S18p-alanine acetyltransferase [Weissella jogaejeotgali]CCC57014.1 ribosomal-protein-alanine acetyltransferase [Weissella thailandensis fsh4-2]
MWKKFNQLVHWWDKPVSEEMREFRQKIVIKDFEFDLMPAKHSDLEDIMALEKAAYNDTILWPMSAFSEELRRTRDRLYVIVRQPETGSMVALIGAAFRPGIHEVHITNIMVTPHWQSRGVGTFLVMYMMTIAQQINFHRISLEVRVSNKRAQQLYERLGFQIVRRKTRYYGEDGGDAFDMAQILGNQIDNELLI